VVSYAADVQMSIQPQLVSLLDRAVLKIEFIDTKGEAVDIPEVDGLDIRYQGQSSETRIVNFKSTSKIIHTYVITPTKTGDFTIGPVTAKFKGGEKELSGQLRVIKPKDDKEAQAISELMFSQISTDRESPHVQEPFDLTLKVYIRDGVQIDGRFSILGGMPESGMDGDLEWDVIDRKRQEYNGSIFNVYTLTTTAKALTAGTFSFQPQVQMRVIIPRQQRRPYGFDDPFFGDLFGRQETRPFTLECNPLEIAVRPVPMEGRPDSFTGAVGIFDFDVNVGPDHVKAGEPITVKMRISGKGNLSKITPPHIADDHAFKLYDARRIPTDNPNTVVFEQVIIPKSGSISNIPPIAFSYFNTKTSDFRTIEQGPFPVSVEAGPQQAAQVIATVPSTIDKKTKVLGRDIVYLKNPPEVWRHETDVPWYHRPIFAGLLGMPAFALVLLAGVTFRRNRLANDVALARRQKAPKAARQHIQLAEKAIRENNSTAFHEAAWQALTAYFGHRLNLAAGDVTVQTVLGRVPELDNVRRLFDTIEQRRYGISAESAISQDEMKQLLTDLTSALKKCERIKL